MSNREKIKEEMLGEINGGLDKSSTPRCDIVNNTFVEEEINRKITVASIFQQFMNLFKKDCRVEDNNNRITDGCDNDIRRI